MPLCNVLRRANKAKKRSSDDYGYGLDVNTTLEDEVFFPGRAPLRTERSWVVDPKHYETPGQSFLKFIKPGHTPKLVGTVYPDPLFGSKRVKRLDEDNIADYIARKDAVLLMFFESDNDKLPANLEWTKNQFVQAAESTKPSGNGFATVDCTRDTVLCADVRYTDINKKAKEYPFFNVFNKRRLTQCITDYKTFDAARMKEVIEKKQPRFQKRQTELPF